MNDYVFWYKNVIKAKDLNNAILKNKKIKPKLDEIKVTNEEIVEGKSCIGFEYHPDSDE